MKLSLIVPVYNERKRLAEVFKYLFSSQCPIEREWIVVDDGSTDGTREFLRELRAQYGYRLIEHPSNHGKGSAVIAGIQAATGDIIGIQDADFEYDPNEIPSLLQPLLANTADVVYGSRFKRSGSQVHRTFHYFGNRFLTLLSNLFSGIYLTDMETCYKFFRSDFLKSMNLKTQRFGIEVELTAYVAKTSARIHELPICYYPRNQRQGKKIGWKDGVAALCHLVRFNWLVSNESAFNNLMPRYQPDAVFFRPEASKHLSS